MINKGELIDNRYKIIKSIGEGGMANVYLAWDTILEREVAVKILRGDLSGDEKFIRRFQREANSASSLKHPNIVEMYDVGEDDGQYYIVMEYVDGKTLKQVLKQRGELSITEVVDIMMQVTDGMAHAHDAYIIHRDIKPQNIMILNNGMIKITDFGVATALNSTQLTQTNSVMGTVHYLPPEQANGKGSTIRSDIYSMGIMMYELLTGLVPYKGDSAVEIALKHLKEPLPSVRKSNPNIPQSIENIIIKATAKNPKNRYTDARTMHEDLKTALDDSRKDEKRYVYPYPENDIEETKVLDKELETLKEESDKPTKKSKREVENDFFEEEKGGNKLLIALMSIFVGLVLVVTVLFLLYFYSGEEKDIIIPENLAGKTVKEVTNILVDLGFEVSTESKTVASETIEEGKVVNTIPEMGTKRKEGTTIVLQVSSGNKTYIMEDFTGKDYREAKGKIEAECECNVIIEYESVSEDEKKKEDTVLKTIPAAGEASKIGEQITIVIPKTEYKYPDFTTYTLDKIEEFAEKHELKLEYKYQESTTLKEGSVIKQSRAKGSVVTPGATLVITVATAPEVDEPIVDEDFNENTGE